MDSPFTNCSQLGSFGEFVYKRFVEQQGYKVERTNFCHTDFLVSIAHERFYVDVKSFPRKNDRYRGRRHHSEIIYDMILVYDGVVHIVPDDRSPFKSLGAQKIESLETLVDAWRTKTASPGKKRGVGAGDVRNDLAEAFAAAGFPDWRLVERGDASRTRWSGTVDNLPGTLSTIDTYDATLFIQYGCEFSGGVFTQSKVEFMLFPHRMIGDGQVPMRTPNKRQQDKGIERVVDLQKFRHEHSELVFKRIEDLKSYLKKRSL